MVSRKSSRDSADSKSSKSTRATSVSSLSPKTEGHYHDWPNTQGFDVHYEERSPVELETSGDIPAYAAGVLFRTGLGPRSFDHNGETAYTANHWFDAFSQVHRFQIHRPRSSSDKVRVTYNSRLTSDGLIEKVTKTGKLDQYTFAARYDPCRSFFQKVQGVFAPTPQDFAPNDVNNAVTLSVNFPGLSSEGEQATGGHDNDTIATLCNKTDAARVQMLDPETLEPIGLAKQSVLHPSLKGTASGAHSKSDPVTGDVFNYNLEFGGPKSTYRVFRASASTGKTSVLATIKDEPAYLHSIFLSEHYVIMCVWNSHFKGYGASILWTKNLLDAMFHNDKYPATWYVIDKRCPETEGGKGLVATYESNHFFAFHSVNAFEERNPETGKIDVIADIPAYKSTDSIRHFYIDNLLSNSERATTLFSSLKPDEILASLHRFRLSDVPDPFALSTATESLPVQTRKATIDFTAPPLSTPELPTLNFNYFTKPYRYIYGILGADGSKSTFVDGLLKYDLSTRSLAHQWSRPGHTPGEAIFVPNPQGTAEDDGVLLSVVLDGFKGTSYLLCLDARNFAEVGRAEVPGAVGFGFHGVYTRNGLETQGGERGLDF